MSESEIAAKAEMGTLREPWKPKRTPLWMRVANGRVYRVAMRVMHRLGWCYPERTFVNETGVWCHWCGMRGTRSLPLAGIAALESLKREADRAVSDSQSKTKRG